MMPANIDTLYIVSKDTVYISNLDPEIVKYYTDILEKTNSQLSLWTNPYGIFFAGIAILFTLLAAFATYIHFKQTKDYKDQVNSEIISLRALVENFILQKEKALKTLVDNSLQSHKEEIGQITKDSPDYKKLEEKIKELESTKKDVDSKLSNGIAARATKRKKRRMFAGIDFGVGRSSGSGGGFAARVGYTFTCSKCSKPFGAMSLIPFPICPYCGTEVNTLRNL